jgi:membrane-associated PAP2 superfamily phosphatase
MTAPHSHTAWRELAVLLALAVAGTAPFWFTDLDLRAARYFYRPELSGDGWPLAREPVWNFFYEYAGAMTALFALSGLAVMVAGSVKERWRRWRVHGVFAVLLVLLGPGLVVNAIFKGHWGRPRPEHVQALGGQVPYLPPLAIGEPGKYKSFPCGHCSVGFSFAALWLVLRRHHRRFAWLALLGGTTLGALMGVGRMAAGDHWLSDTVWAALFPWLVGWGLYYGLLKMHREPGLGQHHATPARRRREAAG